MEAMYNSSSQSCDATVGVPTKSILGDTGCGVAGGVPGTNGNWTTGSGGAPSGCGMEDDEASTRVYNAKGAPACTCRR